MIDIKETITNPYVIAAGVGLGLVILFMRGASANAAGDGSIPYSYNPGFQVSGAAYQYFTAQGQQAAQVGIASINADVSKQIALLSTIKAFDDNASILSARTLESNNGILNSQITSMTNLQLDRQQNATRLQQTYVAANVALHGQDVALATTQIQQAGSIELGRIASTVALNTANINADTAIRTATLNAQTALGLSADQIKIAQINSQTVLGVATTSSQTQLGVAKIQAKKSSNDLIGSIVKGAASLFSFL